MAETITVPDFQFSAFFYADILDALMRFKRINVPELTDESEFEPLIQMLRAFALVGHLNNVNVDIVANENTLPTSKLAETVRNMFRLIDFELRPPSPAQVDIVYELARVFNSGILLVPEGARAATPKTAEVESITFEVNESLTIERTDQFLAVFGEDGGVFTDHTIAANAVATAWGPWATPAVRDAVYFGHANVMWNTLNVDVNTAMSGLTGVWEYYDGNFDKTQPDEVADVGGGQLRFVLNGYLGNVNRAGTLIRVKLNDTAVTEDVYVQWTGSENVVFTGLLGQSVPSEDADDYTVGSDWEPVPDVDDGTANLTVDGEVIYTLPQTLTDNWQQGTVNNVEAYWLRFRITEANTPVAPGLFRCRMDTGGQYVSRLATQGKERTDSPLGSSTGLPNQRFRASQPNFIVGSDTIEVDTVAWTRVDDFLDSDPTDEHYRVELVTDDTAEFIFGDGITGRIPPVGVGNIVANYRYGADINGNVGSNTVTIDKSGLSYTNRLWNPRPAGGWSEGDAASEASLERVKQLGPKTVRTQEVAVAASDLIPFTENFVDTNGARPYSRASVFEEGFGPKTVELTVVLKGGGQATQDQLDALMLFFNGDKFAVPPAESHFVSNQQVVAVNHDQRGIDVEAIVYGRVTAVQVENALRKVFHPEATKESGDWEWEMGDLVPRARVSHEIFDIDETITNVVLTLPASDIQLSSRQLPVINSVSITIVEP